MQLLDYKFIRQIIEEEGKTLQEAFDILNFCKGYYKNIIHQVLQDTELLNEMSIKEEKYDFQSCYYNSMFCFMDEVTDDIRELVELLDANGIELPVRLKIKYQAY